MIKTLNTLFVTMFGLGKISKIPGTLGSLATVIVLYFFFHIFDISSDIVSKIMKIKIQKK
jgi:phosphatidylglycerophosphatase A